MNQSRLLAALPLLTLPLAVNAATTVLYDGSTGFNSPPLTYGLGADGVQWLGYGEVPLPSLSNPVPKASGVGTTSLNTDLGTGNSGYSGYANYGLTSIFPSIQIGLLQSAFPQLDRTEGFSFDFTVAVTSEASNPNRAGFSILVLASDGAGIELGFKAEDGGRIFAQSATFTEAETAAFDISQSTSYSLQIQGDTYTLMAGETTVLTGAVRNYQFDPDASDPPLPFNPYESPNLVFLGDNTDQANAQFTLGQVAINTGVNTGEPTTEEPTEEPTTEEPTTPVLDFENIPQLETALSCADNVSYAQRPDLAAAGVLEGVNSIPLIQIAGWQFEQQAEYGYLSVMLGSDRYAVQPLGLQATTTTEGAGLQPPDTLYFTTSAGVELIAPPAIQAPCALQAALAALQLPKYNVLSNGNLRIELSDSSWILARPSLIASPASEGANSDLLSIGMVENTGIFSLLYTFTEASQMWQQMLLPMPADETAFMSAVTEYDRSSSGRISFSYEAQSYQGMFDVLVSQGEASGSFSIQAMGDVNGDGFEDYQVNFADGVQQLFYGMQ